MPAFMRRASADRRPSAVPAALLVASIALTACSRLGAPGLGGGPVNEPLPPLGHPRGEVASRYFMLDSNDIVVIARRREAIAPAFVRLDAAARDHRRYLQAVPVRTAVVLVDEPADSVLLAAPAAAARARLTVWSRPRNESDGGRSAAGRDGEDGPRSGDAAMTGVGSAVLRVATEWLSVPDPHGGVLAPWIVAGLAQLLSDTPARELRDAVLGAQHAELLPLDSLPHVRIPQRAGADSLPGPGEAMARLVGAASLAAGAGEGGGERDRSGRRPPRVDPPTLAAMQASSVLEFLWGREGRWIVTALADASRRGGTLADVLPDAREVPNDLVRFEALWRSSLAR